MKLGLLNISGGYHKYNEILFMKGFSILTIVVMHLIHGYMTFLPHIIQQAAFLGGTGVHIFFFCSGFGLFMSYQNRQTKYFEFIKKRMLRVYIPYAVAILLYFIVPMVKFDGDRMGALASHLLLYKMFIPKYESSFGEHWWFLSTLFQFYLVFIPLCKLKQLIGTKKFFIFGFAISLLWWIAMAITGLNEERIWGSFFFQYLWEFCLGMIIAERLYNGVEIKLPNKILLLVAIIGIGIEGFLGVTGGWAKALNDFPALFGYGALVLLVYQIRPLQKIGIWLGNISYEWYLLHILIFVLVFSIMSGWLASIFAFVISISMAFVFHKIIVLIQKNYSR